MRNKEIRKTVKRVCERVHDVLVPPVCYSNQHKRTNAFYSLSSVRLSLLSVRTSNHDRKHQRIIIVITQG